MSGEIAGATQAFDWAPFLTWFAVVEFQVFLLRRYDLDTDRTACRPVVDSCPNEKKSFHTVERVIYRYIKIIYRYIIL